MCDSRLYRSHFDFDADLSRYIKPNEIEKVKNVMTYDVVNVTYKAYLDMIPTLKEEEKHLLRDRRLRSLSSIFIQSQPQMVDMTQ